MKSSTTRQIITRITAGALIFYLFSGVSSILNYAFYPVVARFVTVSEYGEIQFLVSMFTQLAVGFVVLNILAIIIGAELKNAKDQARSIRSLNIIAGLAILLITLIGLVVLVGQKDALSLTSTSAVVALCLSLLINVPFTVAIGRLQGSGKFVASGVISMLGALFKLIFSLLFIILGYGVAGAIFGIFIGMATSLIIVEFINRRLKKPSRANTPTPFRHHLAQLAFIKHRSMVALLAVTVITLLSAADSITSRVVLSSVEAGHYASIATVAKMILAATSPLMWLALPPAIQRNHRSVLTYALIALAISIAAGVCFNLAPTFFTNVIIGVDAKQYISLLPIATIGMTLCATAFIILTAAICLGYLRRVVTVTIIAVVAYTITTLLLQHLTGALVASLYGQIAGSIVFIAGLSMYTFKERKQRIEYFN